LLDKAVISKQKRGNKNSSKYVTFRLRKSSKSLRDTISQIIGEMSVQNIDIEI
jgi:hypothetical protein